MKYINATVLLSFLFCLSLTAQQDSVRLQCSLKNCAGDLYLYTFNGFGFEEVGHAVARGESLVEFAVPKTLPRFYYIGTSPTQTKPLLLGNEPLVKVEGPCNPIRATQIMQSPLNQQYLQLRGELAKLTRAHNVQIRELSKAYRAQDGETIEAAVTELQQIDLKKADLLDSIRREDAFLYSIAALNTMLSYQNNKGKYDNEVEYYGNEYFRFIDLNNPALTGNSMVYEAFRNYATTLSSVGLPADVHLAFMKNGLALTGENDEVYQLAIGGILSALERTSHANYKPLAQAFVDRFWDKEPAICKQLQQKLTAMKGISIGGEAPDFSQATPEGAELSLSDLRGKIVLVDFWASWCGPCRRENPNVVRLYNRYKDQGFEILGVSLDRDRDRWLKAIDADKLTWRHVSDLKGWSNSVAKMYGVRSIPHTILLDAEGKVIARNLRGESLARKLEELFGGETKGG